MKKLDLDNDVLSNRLRTLLGCERERRSFGLRLFFGSAMLLWGIAALISWFEGSFWPAKNLLSPFSWDVSMYSLFLFALPVILGNGPTFADVQHRVLAAMLEEGVMDMSASQYDEIVEETNAILNGKKLHALMLCGAWFASFTWAYTSLHLLIGSWHGIPGAAGLREASWALIYVALVALPIPLYVIMAWTFKAIVWNWFVYRLSNRGLKANALHPDGAAGLGFFRYSSMAWGSYILCVGFAVAGDVFNHLYVLHSVEFRYDVLAKIGAYVVIAPAIFLLPLIMLAPHIVRARKEGELLLFSYGRKYAEEITYTLQHSRAGSDGETPSAHQGYWSGLCDYLSVYDRVRSMNLVPLDLAAILRIAVTVAAPLIPLIAPKLPFVARFIEAWIN